MIITTLSPDPAAIYRPIKQSLINTAQSLADCLFPNRTCPICNDMVQDLTKKVLKALPSKTGVRPLSKREISAITTFSLQKTPGCNDVVHMTIKEQLEPLLRFFCEVLNGGESNEDRACLTLQAVCDIDRKTAITALVQLALAIEGLQKSSLNPKYLKKWKRSPLNQMRKNPELKTFSRAVSKRDIVWICERDQLVFNLICKERKSSGDPNLLTKVDILNSVQ